VPHSPVVGASVGQAVGTALPGTDDEAETGWYGYRLAGTPPLTVAVARSVGADPVMVEVTGEMDAVLMLAWTP
jgi:hypothetical protein